MNIKLYYNGVVVKAGWYWQKKTHRLMEKIRKPWNGHITIWSTNLWQSRKDYQMEKVLSTTGVGKTGQHRELVTNLDHFLTVHTKINTKWMKDLNVRQETIKILEENTGTNLFDLVQNKFLLDMSPEARETIAKINYWDLIKIKSFCTAKNKSRKLKGNWQNGGEIFVWHLR